jgi:hypothetical protein
MVNLDQHFKGQPFAIVAVDVREKEETVIKYVQSQSLSYVNLLDPDGSVGALYGVSSTPVKFLIDANGNVVGRALGYREWDGDEMKELIQLLIANSAKEQ